MTRATPNPAPRPRSRTRPEAAGLKPRVWNLLILVPIVGVLIPPVYNRSNPELFNIPFFYWWQLAWVVITVLLTTLLSRMTAERR
jgi:hypothetical protein